MPSSSSIVAADPARPSLAVAAALEFLSFRLGTDYGIDILAVQEIRGHEVPTRMPGTAASVQGVLNLRGTIVPIVDLRQLLGLEPVALGPSTVTIILHLGQRWLGLVVDAVNDVVALEPDRIQPVPPLDANRSPFVTRVATQHADGAASTLLLLDTQRLVDATLAAH